MTSLISVSSDSFSNTYAGKKVWLSGHTGFKGAWLAEWLLMLGAEVHGYALEPATRSSLFDQLELADRLHHEVGDIRDQKKVEQSLLTFQPDFVFHLAAQPLVRYSYAHPLETYETNVMGTLYVLEALRSLEEQRHAKFGNSASSVAAVMITTDKCYENSGEGIAFREENALGGHDPYSSSKAMDEIAIAAYRNSYFKNRSMIRLASARAGNVIGGGDMALDRIVPDAMRAIALGQPIEVRHPLSIRPWQHVLEPLSGYLWLGAQLMKDPSMATAFNFGPGPEENYRVQDLVEQLLKHWPGEWRDVSNHQAMHEAHLLHLSIDKASSLLGWRPVWDFKKTVAETAAWYRSHHQQLSDSLTMTQRQILAYTKDAKVAGVAWAIF